MNLTAIVRRSTIDRIRHPQQNTQQDTASTTQQRNRRDTRETAAPRRCTCSRADRARAHTSRLSFDSISVGGAALRPRRPPSSSARRESRDRRGRTADARRYRDHRRRGRRDARRALATRVGRRSANGKLTVPPRPARAALRVSSAWRARYFLFIRSVHIRNNIV